jgi:arylsulfatase A-like enzyme
MQGDSLLAAEPRGLPPGKILPQYLKDLGYTTRAVGKWHLGFYKREVTPTYRGFDSHLGYWNDYVSYYDYILQERVNMLALRFSREMLRCRVQRFSAVSEESAASNAKHITSEK